ncbi:Ku protein [Alteribacter natronophilus]|uniref:non-homologous end joining protein Ku n=1 Tax=Alteribacter natronophilus TaxID=2583810 RepID=UPI00110D3099|nr:Ku protein [Alteribacter natronophilus]TMW73490.1 Ku protein [Alteribacter natronophilus]
MHTIWKGSISFGLVNIPIKLHAATENKDVSLRQLHKECHTPIRYDKVCPHCEKSVENDDIVKGYEQAKDQFVIIENDELKEIQKVQADRAVEIIDFVELTEIDPIYFNRSYYLSPGEGGTKAYTLLRQALEDSGKIGVAKIMLRAKEHLAVLRVYKNTLLMETIHFPDEVRAADQVPGVPEESELTKKELSSAKMLIDNLTTAFDPDKYTDEYREELQKLIAAKREGNETVKVEQPELDTSNVTNLMDALQESIEKTKKKKKATGGRKKTASKKKNA